MSDLLAPVLFVTQNEVESFWCLTGFMNLLVGLEGLVLVLDVILDTDSCWSCSTRTLRSPRRP